MYGFLTERLDVFILAEWVIVAVFIWLALARPETGSRLFSAIERYVSSIASRPVRSLFVIGSLAILLRASILPWAGSPYPHSWDDLSIYFQAQTLASGRWANPTHPFWEHFETMYITHVPSYASMYFPGRGIAAALGLLIADSAWIGVWFSVVLMCMATTWMLQAWVPLPFAFAGGLIVVLRYATFSHYINGYTAAPTSALGAMLVIGALPRILKNPSVGLGFLLGIGMAVLMITRPFEGMLVCVPVALVLLRQLFRARLNDASAMIAKVLVPSSAAVLVGGLILALSNQAVTGSATTTPYGWFRTLYAQAPALLISQPIVPIRGPEVTPPYFEEAIAKEAEPHIERTSPQRIARNILGKTFHTWNYYIGALLSVAFAAGLYHCRKNRFIVGSGVLYFAGFMLITWNFPQYTAPLLPLLMILIMSGFWILRRLKIEGRPTGLFLTRAMISASVLNLVLPVAATIVEPRLLETSGFYTHCCTTATTKTIKQLATDDVLRHSAKALVLVKSRREGPHHTKLVYNEPDIDKSPVVWAHSLGEAKDNKLMTYFADRDVWEIEWKAEKPGYKLKLVALPER